MSKPKIPIEIFESQNTKKQRIPMSFISFDGGAKLPIEIKPGDTIGDIIRKVLDPSKFVQNCLVLYKNRIIFHEKPLDKQDVTDGLIEVFPNVSTTSQTQRKMLSQHIEDLGIEASRIMDFKIEKTMTDPHVMAVCNSFINSNPEEMYPVYYQYGNSSHNDIYDPSVFPAEELEPGIPTKPLPMEWKSEQQLDYLAEPQEPLFNSITEARKYYSSQMTDHSWDW